MSSVVSGSTERCTERRSINWKTRESDGFKRDKRKRRSCDATVTFRRSLQPLRISIESMLTLLLSNDSHSLNQSVLNSFPRVCSTRLTREWSFHSKSCHFVPQWWTCNIITSLLSSTSITSDIFTVLYL